MAEEEKSEPDRGDGSDRPRRNSNRDRDQDDNTQHGDARNSNPRRYRDDNRRPYRARSDRGDRPYRARSDRGDSDRRPYQFRGDPSDGRTGYGLSRRDRGDGGQAPFGRGSRQQDFHPRRRDNEGTPRDGGKSRPWRRNNEEDSRSTSGHRRDDDTRSPRYGYGGRGNYGHGAGSRGSRDDRGRFDRDSRPEWSGGYQERRSEDRRQSDGYRRRGDGDRPNTNGERRADGYGSRGNNDHRNDTDRGFRPNRGGYQGSGGPDRGQSTGQGSRGRRDGYTGERPQRRPLRDDLEGRGLHNDDNGRDTRPQREWLPPEEYQRRKQLRSVRPRVEEPEIPADVRDKDLDFAARLELKTLSKENAENVARHLVMASRLIEDDPEAAHQHALAASRRAGRVAVVRETLGITAYAIGDFALALRELRTYRRISGRDDQIALLVDSERGIGRPEKALEEGRSVDRSMLNKDVRAQLAIAMSGARLDLGQAEPALAELEIPELDPDVAYGFSPELFAAYAEVLDELGRDEEAARWRERAETAEEALEKASDTAGLETIAVEVIESDDDDVPDSDELDTAGEIPTGDDIHPAREEDKHEVTGEQEVARIGEPGSGGFGADEGHTSAGEVTVESDASLGELKTGGED